MLPDGFLLPPYPLNQTKNGPVIPDFSEKNMKFAPLLLRMSLNKKPSHNKFSQIPYDMYCPSVQESINDRTCSVCHVYFSSKKGMKNHKKNLHGKSQSKEGKIRPLRVLRKRRGEVLCRLSETGEREWFDEDDVEISEKVEEIPKEKNVYDIPVINNFMDWTSSNFEEDISI